MNNCTLLLSSYDGGEDLWEGFFKCLYNNWPEFDMPIVLNTETKEYSFVGYDINKAVFADKEYTWSERLKESLKQIKTDYVLFFLEDFWLNQRVNNDLFLEAFDFIKNNNNISTISFYPTFTKNIDNNKLNGYELRPKKCKYKLNCQAALWKKEKLISYLRNHESAWEFEINGSIRAGRYYDEFYSIKNDAKKVFSYEWGGVIHRGKWFNEGINEYINKYNLSLDPKIRGYANWKNEEKQKLSLLDRIRKPHLLSRICIIINKKIRKFMSLI